MTIGAPEIPLAWAAVPPGALRRDIAWSLVRRLAGGDVAIANACPRCGGPHGPVTLPGTGLRASVAYSGGLALAAVAGPGLTALGLDAEPEGREAPGIGTLRHWVRVEAVLKADGRGLRLDPATVLIEQDAAGELAGRADAASARLVVRDLAGPEGHLVSVAYRTADAADAAGPVR